VVILNLVVSMCGRYGFMKRCRIDDIFEDFFLNFCLNCEWTLSVNYGDGST
jgi:hypothetical protein